VDLSLTRETPGTGARDQGALPAAALVNVSKTFEAKGNRVDAVEDASLAVRPQEFVCIIGPSGCGKSTILSLLAGLVEPTKGHVSINGRDARQACRDRQIGLVFQDPVLLPWRTVGENIAVPLEIVRTPKGERARIVDGLLELVGLRGFGARFPHELSGGMRQRVGIARALSFDPPILLMDEPFGALDAITRDKMALELLKVWQRRQKTVVFVTHSISEAALLSDRVIVLSPRPGRIRAVIENPMPRPRTLAMRDEPDFLRVTRRMRELLELE
jgi:NitT/TauT family transport system ATP-binding protein